MYHPNLLPPALNLRLSMKTIYIGMSPPTVFGTVILECSSLNMGDSQFACIACEYLTALPGPSDLQSMGLKYNTDRCRPTHGLWTVVFLYLLAAEPHKGRVLWPCLSPTPDTYGKQSLPSTPLCPCPLRWVSSAGDSKGSPGPRMTKSRDSWPEDSDSVMYECRRENQWGRGNL